MRSIYDAFEGFLSESGSEYTAYVRWPHDFRSEDFTDIRRDEVKRSGPRKYYICSEYSRSSVI